jgi:hypothetical protein
MVPHKGNLGKAFLTQPKKAFLTQPKKAFLTQPKKEAGWTKPS